MDVRWSCIRRLLEGRSGREPEVFIPAKSDRISPALPSHPHSYQSLHLPYNATLLLSRLNVPATPPNRSSTGSAIFTSETASSTSTREYPPAPTPPRHVSTDSSESAGEDPPSSPAEGYPTPPPPYHANVIYPTVRSPIPASAFSDTTSSTSSPRAPPPGRPTIPGQDSNLTLLAPGSSPARSSPSEHSFMARSLAPLRTLLEDQNDHAHRDAPTHTTQPSLQLVEWKVAMGAEMSLRAVFRCLSDNTADALNTQFSGLGISGTSPVDLSCSNMSDSDEEGDLVWLRIVRRQTSGAEGSKREAWEEALGELFSEVYDDSWKSMGSRGGYHKILSGSYSVTGICSEQADPMGDSAEIQDKLAAGKEADASLSSSPTSEDTEGSKGFGRAGTDITASWRMSEDGMLEEIQVELRPTVSQS